MNMEFLRNNTIAKVIAVVSAVFLWLFVINDGYRVDYLDTPLRVGEINISTGLSLENDIEKVDVRIRAPLSAWAAVSADDFIATIDLDDLSVGSHDVPVRVVADGQEIQIIDVVPKNITVQIEEVISEEKNVSVIIQGQPGEDYAVSDPEIEIEKVLVTGTQKTLDELNEIVAFVDVSSAMSTVSKTSELFARGVNDKNLHVSIEPSTIQITVPVHRQADVKTVGVRVGTMGTLSEGVSLESAVAEPSVVTIQGEEDVLKDISYIETGGIDLSPIVDSDTFKRQLVLPEGVSLVDQDENVFIAVKVQNIKKTKVIDITARAINLGAGLRVIINPPRARLVLEGSDAALATATDTTIKITLDLNGKGSGRLTLPVTKSLVTLPDGVTVKDIETKQFEIIIE